MARSHVIYLAVHGSAVLSAYTVKHEALTAIGRYREANPGLDIRLLRLRDSGPIGQALVPVEIPD